MYAINLDSDGVLMSRFFAGTFNWNWTYPLALRNADWNVLKVITLSLCIADTLGFIIALVGQLAGVMNDLAGLLSQSGFFWLRVWGIFVS